MILKCYTTWLFAKKNIQMKVKRRSCKQSRGGSDLSEEGKILREGSGEEGKWK